MARAVHVDHLARLLPIRVHDLNLTYASLALLAGILPNLVSERLGHANLGITLNLYSHVTKGMDRTAADLVGWLLDTTLNPVAQRVHGPAAAASGHRVRRRNRSSEGLSLPSEGGQPADGT